MSVSDLELVQPVVSCRFGAEPQSKVRGTPGYQLRYTAMGAVTYY